MQHIGSQFPDQGSNLRLQPPLHIGSMQLTTGSPGKSQNKWFLNTGNFYVIYKEQKWNLLQACTHIFTFLQVSLTCWPKSTGVASISRDPQCGLSDNHHRLSPQGQSLLLSACLVPCSINHFLFPVLSMLSCSGCVIFAAYCLTLKWVLKYTDVLKHQIIWRTYWSLNWL